MIARSPQVLVSCMKALQILIQFPKCLAPCMQIKRVVASILVWVECLILEQDELFKMKDPEQIELGKILGSSYSPRLTMPANLSGSKSLVTSDAAPATSSDRSSGLCFWNDCKVQALLRFIQAT